jgi:hypothetical protein
MMESARRVGTAVGELIRPRAAAPMLRSVGVGAGEVKDCSKFVDISGMKTIREKCIIIGFNSLLSITFRDLCFKK